MSTVDMLKVVEPGEVSAADRAEALAAEAHSIVTDRLERFGNRLSPAHRQALHDLARLFSQSALGLQPGRFAVPLDTGMGKTQSVVAWCAALHRLGYSELSVVVAAHKVEALCDLKRDLIAAGVPEAWVGLRYSKGIAASFPSTTDNEARPILLATHAGVKSAKAGNVELFNRYGKKPRSLVIWDESLIVSKAFALSLCDVRSEAAYLEVQEEANTHAAAPLTYIADTLAALKAEEVRQKTGHPAVPLELQSPAEIVEQCASLTARHAARVPALADLIGMLGQRLRVVTTEGGGIVRYDLAVPRELTNVVALDASYPIRTLERLDPSIQQGPVRCQGLKHYGDVTVHQLRVGDGRTSVEPNLRAYADEVAELVQSLPVNEGVLVFVFRDRGAHGARRLMSHRGEIERGLRERGVSLDATVETAEGPRLRIVFRTWGDATSCSQHAYCRHVVFAGVLHRSALDVAAHMVGQTGDLSLPVPQAEVLAAVRSEAAHGIYQAMSRGACRIMDGDRAQRMDAYLIHRDARVADLLGPVMPGVQWKRWTGARLGLDSKTEQAADRILQYLDALPQATTTISCRALKQALNFEGAARTFARAREIAVEGTEGRWRSEGRSILRSWT